MSAEPIVVWGGGAIGGTIAAYWARAGIPVLLVDTVREHVEACRTRGLSIEGPLEQFTVPMPAATPDEVTGTYSRIVLAVKAQHTDAALDALLPHLAADGYILSAQNGLNEIAIAARAGDARTLGAFVNFGADWLGPGRIRYGGRGDVVLGEIDGAPRARTVEMHKLLQVFEPDAILTDHIWGYLWSKLIYAGMLFATALNDDGIAGNFADPSRFAAFDRLGREVMAVARVRNVVPMPLQGFDPAAFMPGAPAKARRACLDLLAERRRNTGKTHTGFWRDLAVRKRPTEIEPLLGTVVALGREAGVPTPALRVLIRLVHDIECGHRKLSRDTFDLLLDYCHALER